VIVVVLVLVLILPGFDAEYGLWGKYIGADRGGLRMLHDVAVADGADTPAFSAALQVGGGLKGG
jgi:hypothetical protein